MTTFLALRYRRATYRHLCSHNDAAQLPEALLNVLFDRYYAITRTAARYGSSVPGPMENRRRIGKRHMAELNFGQSRSASPLWALENLPDLTQWKWKPPSSSDELLRQDIARDGKQRGIVQSMMKWFASSTDPALAPAPDIASVDVGDYLIHEPDAAEQPLQRIVWNSQTGPSEIIETGLDLISRDLSSDMTVVIKPNFSDFRDRFRECLANGIFSGETTCSVLDGIYNGLAILQSNTVKPLERTIANQFMLGLLTTTILGLSNSSIHKHNDSAHLIWEKILQITSKLQMNSLRILTDSVSNIPDHRLGDISPYILLNLNAYLMASGRERKHSSLVRQANKMAKSLRSLDLASHPQILECGTSYVLNYMASNSAGYSQVRFSWLQLLARLPNVDFDSLVETCSVLESGKHAEPLSNKEICEMYLARHRSTIKEAPTVRNMLAEEVHGNKDSRFYGLFSMAFWQTGQFDHVKDFCKFLEKLGRDQDVMRLAKGLRNLVSNEVRPLANIAIGGRLPLLAIEIISIYEKSRASSRLFWDSEFSSKALKLLMDSPFLRQIEVLRALRVRCLSRRRRYRYGLASKHEIQKITLKAIQAARAVAISPVITPRTSLNLITQCIYYLQRLPRAVVPVPVLRALLHIVTRDLARGGPGRTARIRWVLGLLHRNVGRDHMVRIGLGLRRWRELNLKELNDRRRREGVGWSAS
ncbi:uncharacterized protein GGS22DRAFT_149939 [Annulohypoxylon maeteangense]|uniref:uncharacterized protein n=1 Tax=Annulohypoxylon maeteangense TaxID=1927788 RepID=UPI0020087D6B|nr:uncharacterized protein GGS22DRAFT_149939 [Annulohypoxylon maeteangense]KAI0890074.1 hypothetical protein GGS22DRAFT_149939 [Annulohypoxylon maeteangense]